MAGGHRDKGDGAGAVRPGESPAAEARTERGLASLDDEALMAAIRDGDPDALHEFFARFAPALRRKAARLGVPSEQRDDIVTELLEDAAIRVLEHRMPRVRSLVHYLVQALHNRVLNDRKRVQRLDGRVMRAAARESLDDRAEDDGVVIALMSEFALSAARGEDIQHEGRDADSCSTLYRLGALLRAEMTEDEQRIMGWLGEWISQRDIAEWLGATYDATRTRVSRLRARLARVAERYAQSLPPPEREVVKRLRAQTAYRRAPTAVRNDDDAPESAGPSDYGRGEEP